MLENLEWISKKDSGENETQKELDELLQSPVFVTEFFINCLTENLGNC